MQVSDYLLSVKTDLATQEQTDISLPKSNVLEFDLSGENKLIIRPSGTEPKVKFYMTATGKSRADAKEIISKITDAVKNDIVNKYA